MRRRATCKVVPRRVQTLALLAIAALLANSQCYAFCLSSLCQSSLEQRHDDCHGSSSNTNQSRRCHHRYSSLTSVEASQNISNLVIVQHASAFLLNGTIRTRLDPIREHNFAASERGSPPGYVWSSSITVLRI